MTGYLLALVERQTARQHLHKQMVAAIRCLTVQGQSQPSHILSAADTATSGSQQQCAFAAAWLGAYLQDKALVYPALLVSLGRCTTF